MFLLLRTTPTFAPLAKLRRTGRICGSPDLLGFFFHARIGIYPKSMRNTTKKSSKKTEEAMVNIPLSALKYLSRYPNEKKIIVEISTDDIRRVNRAETLDEIISEARLDYALGNYTTHTTAKSLIAALES